MTDDIRHLDELSDEALLDGWETATEMLRGAYRREIAGRLVMARKGEMKGPWWLGECEILEKYLPPKAREGDRPRCVVRHIPTGSFLRYSKGPRQGHFWDVYGEDYQNENLARLALHQAPVPWKMTPPESVAADREVEAELNKLRLRVGELEATVADRDKTNKYLRDRLHKVHDASNVA